MVRYRLCQPAYVEVHLLTLDRYPIACKLAQEHCSLVFVASTLRPILEQEPISQHFCRRNARAPAVCSALLPCAVLLHQGMRLRLRLRLRLRRFTSASTASDSGDVEDVVDMAGVKAHTLRAVLAGAQTTSKAWYTRRLKRPTSTKRTFV